MSPRPTRLFVGVGNVLKRDDGLGVRAAEIMARLPQSPDVEVYEAGVGGLELAAVLEERNLVVIVDAVDADAEPGAVFRFAPDELLPFVRTRLSLHDLHLLDALAETQMRGRAPRRVVIFAVQVDDVSTGIGLTPATAAALDRAVAMAARELGLPADSLERTAVESTWSS